MKTLLITILILCTVVLAVPASGAPVRINKLKKSLARVSLDNIKHKAIRARQEKIIKTQTNEIDALKKQIIKLNIVKRQNVKYVRQNRLLIQYVKELRMFIMDKLGVEALDSIAPPKTITKPKTTRGTLEGFGIN